MTTTTMQQPIAITNENDDKFNRIMSHNIQPWADALRAEGVEQAELLYTENHSSDYSQHEYIAKADGRYFHLYIEAENAWADASSWDYRVVEIDEDDYALEGLVEVAS